MRRALPNASCQSLPQLHASPTSYPYLVPSFLSLPPFFHFVCFTSLEIRLNQLKYNCSISKLMRTEYVKILLNFFIENQPIGTFYILCNILCNIWPGIILEQSNSHYHRTMYDTFIPIIWHI